MPSILYRFPYMYLLLTIPFPNFILAEELFYFRLSTKSLLEAPHLMYRFVYTKRDVNEIDSPFTISIIILHIQKNQMLKSA